MYVGTIGRLYFWDEVWRLHRLGGLILKNTDRKTNLEIQSDWHQTIKDFRKNLSKQVFKSGLTARL